MVDSVEEDGSCSGSWVGGQGAGEEFWGGDVVNAALSGWIWICKANSVMGWNI